MTSSNGHTQTYRLVFLTYAVPTTIPGTYRALNYSLSNNVYIYIYIYIYICVCVCVCVCIYRIKRKSEISAGCYKGITRILEPGYEGIRAGVREY